MGRKKKHETQPTADATRQHNAAALGEAIGNSLEQLYKLDCEIAALTEKHLKPLREAKADIRKRLRDDFEIKNDVISARYGSFKIERKATDASDDELLDSIREAYDALPIGGMVNMVDVLGTRPAAE